MTFGAAALSQFLAGPNVKDTYLRLDKPGWAPASEVFGPVWGGLYLALTVATALATASGEESKDVWPLFGAQLAANAAWTPLFFRLKSYEAAEIDAALLTVLVVFLARAYARRSRTAAALLLPMAGWCSFATVLTHAIRRRARAGS